ncbi:unnamed protein product [Heligmosomoides polygyrus]|uniref:Uncharacterized protein n=1 Tax=Heligmosomoides polygyrus TaxID=6339 RepID=A0A183GB39_HELPZ|nr:unnamed protein product [Heligmosomoides polygyrus]
MEAVVLLETEVRRNVDESFVKLHKLISERSSGCRFPPTMNLIPGWQCHASPQSTGRPFTWFKMSRSYLSYEASN